MFLIDFSSVGFRKNLHKTRMKQLEHWSISGEDCNWKMVLLTGSNDVRLELFVRC